MNTPPTHDELRAALENFMGVLFNDGNDVVLYRNGVRIFSPIMDAIARASTASRC